jgi:hypothetical protein
MDCAIGAQRGYQEILVCEQHSDQKKEEILYQKVKLISIKNSTPRLLDWTF